MTEIERLQAELVQVQQAISASYGAAEYTINSGGTQRSLKRQNITALTKREQELQRQISRLQAVEAGTGGGAVYYGVPAP